MKQFDLHKVIFLLLIQYLREKNAFEKYCMDVYVYHNIDITGLTPRKSCEKILKSRVDKVSDIYDVMNFFMLYCTAFEWDRTPEGSTYWYSIHVDWREFLLRRGKELGLKNEELEEIGW